MERGASNLVDALVEDQPRNFRALATAESDGKAQRAWLLPLGATNEKFERAAGGGEAGSGSLAIVSRRSVRRWRGCGGRPERRSRSRKACAAGTGLTPLTQKREEGRRHPYKRREAIGSAFLHVQSCKTRTSSIKAGQLDHLTNSHPTAVSLP